MERKQKKEKKYSSFKEAMEQAVLQSFLKRFSSHLTQELHNTSEEKFADLVKHIDIAPINLDNIFSGIICNDTMVSLALDIEQFLLDCTINAKTEAINDVESKAEQFGYDSLSHKLLNTDITGYSGRVHIDIANYIKSYGFYGAGTDKALQIFKTIYMSVYFANLTKLHNAHPDASYANYLEKASEDAVKYALKTFHSNINTPIGNLSVGFPLFWNYVLPYFGEIIRRLLNEKGIDTLCHDEQQLVLEYIFPPRS